jgi:membrane fusion protein
MKKESLFRAAVLENQQDRRLGDVILVRPLSFTLVAVGAGAAAACLLAFLAFGQYTKRSTVRGRLVPEAGVIKIHPQQEGTVAAKFVREGQQVKRGELLFVLSSERQSIAAGPTQAAISGQISARTASLREELRLAGRLQREAEEGAAKRVAALRSELDNLLVQLDGQKSRVRLAEEALARAQQLVGMQFVSKDQVQLKQADLLEQRSRLGVLEREHIASARELSDQQRELASLPLRHSQLNAQLMRSITSAGQELTESEAKRELAIRAPESGTVTAIALERGQLAEPGKAMLSLIPDGSELIAELQVPSRAIGFVRKGSSVLLRYQAYPYQKFGHGKGTVIDVSRTALTPGELGMAADERANGDPLYRITVQLSRQTVQAYGNSEPLQAGMLLEADVLQDSRHLYEWVLEPLFSLTGKL